MSTTFCRDLVLCYGAWGDELQRRRAELILSSLVCAERRDELRGEMRRYKFALIYTPIRKPFPCRAFVGSYIAECGKRVITKQNKTVVCVCIIYYDRKMMKFRRTPRDLLAEALDKRMRRIIYY